MNMEPSSQPPTGFSDAMRNLITGRIQELTEKETESQATLVAKREELEEAKTRVQKLEDDWKEANDLFKAIREERMALENDTLLMAPTDSRGNHNAAQPSPRFSNAMRNLITGRIQELTEKETESQAPLVAKREELEEAKNRVQKLEDDWKEANDLFKAIREERMALENDTLLMVPTRSAGEGNAGQQLHEEENIAIGDGFNNDTEMDGADINGSSAATALARTTLDFDISPEPDTGRAVDMSTANGCSDTNQSTSLKRKRVPPEKEEIYEALLSSVIGTNGVDFFPVPDEILYTVFTFLARSPFLVGRILCWSLNLLSKQWKDSLDADRALLWGLARNVLSSYSYKECESLERNVVRVNASLTRHSRPSYKTRQASDKTPKQLYIDARNLTIHGTEQVVLNLSDLATLGDGIAADKQLKRLLKEEGPIAINHRTLSGHTCLVEVCRAKIEEAEILKCVKLLIKNYMADPNVPSLEYPSRVKDTGMLGTYFGDELYPLVIAAARGMSTVVKYLLESGADKSCRGTCQCYLLSDWRKNVKGVNVTAYEMASKMLTAEEANGLNDHNMDGLRDVMTQLDPLISSNDS